MHDMLLTSQEDNDGFVNQHLDLSDSLGVPITELIEFFLLYSQHVQAILRSYQ